MKQVSTVFWKFMLICTIFTFSVLKIYYNTLELELFKRTF